MEPLPFPDKLDGDDNLSVIIVYQSIFLSLLRYALFIVVAVAAAIVDVVAPRTIDCWWTVVS